MNIDNYAHPEASAPWEVVDTPRIDDIVKYAIQSADYAKLEVGEVTITIKRNTRHKSFIKWLFDN